ncbi:MAG TPA: sugar ABC transporter substrate-binding protein [Aggregatilinea sp.]|uniref:sugar ABC transporter substrate-binding protein n=1 Tax=Aggregatilinea sp. TaxID=2806333 RepID=UPI002D1D5B82|nr:sugar ABC transporter substrate-binding protein [Aggregatilinea sp.]HML21423.1 sugar ABC transporter substrate-binding protein [Aggregatilinea sp.]
MSSAGLAGTWNAQGEEAARWMAGLLGVEITWFDGEFDPQAQRAKFDQLVTQEWDFVAVQPGAIGTLIEPIQTLTESGVPVIDMDTLIAPLQDLQDLGVLAFIAPDNVFMAESVVQRLIDKMEGAGKIAHIGGQPGHTGAQARGQGFFNLVNKYPDIEVVDDQPADWDVTRAADLTESVLNRHPDLKAIFADNDDMALAARQIVENAGLGDQVLVGGVDAMPPAVEAVRDGRLVATARNSANRIHSWAVLAGAWAATVGLDQAKAEMPFYILADGPAIFADIDSNPDLADEPWKLRNYGLSATDGILWAETQYLF